MEAFLRGGAVALLCMVVMVGTASAQDATMGKAVFAADCAACHSVLPGHNGIGPSLAGVYGMRAGTVPGYNFSNELRSSQVIFTDTVLNEFLMDPNSLATGTKMPQPGTVMHVGLPSADDRAAVIAYLRSLKNE